MKKNSCFVIVVGFFCCLGCKPDSKSEQNGSTNKQQHNPGQYKSTNSQQSTIEDLAWSNVTIKMPDGTLKKTTGGQDWVIRPDGCQEWDYKKFGRATQDKAMGHLWPKKPKKQQGTGILPYAIRGLLEQAKGPNVVVIVSTGMTDDLGVSEEAKQYLQELKEKGEIEAYYILNSKNIPNQHNTCVKAGKQVYTLLHTTC